MLFPYISDMTREGGRSGEYDGEGEGAGGGGSNDSLSGNVGEEKSHIFANEVE